MPFAPVFTDTFDRSNRDLNGDNGWVVGVAGHIFIIDEEISNGQTYPMGAWRGAYGGSADYEAAVTLGSISGSWGLEVGLRTTDGDLTGSGYSLGFSSDGNFDIYEAGVHVAGTGGSGAITPAEGDVMAIRAIGGTITAWHNGTQLLSYSDGTYSAAGLPAIRMQNGTANSACFDEFQILVSVDPPDAPTAPAAATGSEPGSIDVNWTAPGDDGGSAITGYVVQTSPAGAGSWTDHATGSTGTSYTVTGLTPGELYDVRVYAVNAVGDGDPSSSVEAAAGAAPSAGRSMMRIWRKAAAICCGTPAEPPR